MRAKKLRCAAMCVRWEFCWAKCCASRRVSRSFRLSKNCAVRRWTGLGGQFIDAFLADHGGIHIGDQQPAAAPRFGLDREIDPRGLQRRPAVPEVGRFRLEREFRRHAGIEPGGLGAVPGAAQAFQRGGGEVAAGRACHQGRDEHEAS